MKIYLLILLAFIIAQAGGVCDSTTLLHHPSSSQFKWPLNTFPAFYAWLNKPWVGDDTPYAALRSQVEQAQKAGNLEAYVKDARSEYAKNPSSHQVQFKYFYSIWMNRTENGVEYSNEDEANVTDYSVYLMKSLSQYPRTYNFTRMAALSVDVWAEEQNAELLPFAKRLVHADPGDIVAEAMLPVIMSSTEQPDLQEKAIQLVNDLANKYSGNANIQATQGYVYSRRWTTNHDPALAQKAIESYDHYLKLAKPGGYFQPIAQYEIRILQKGIASAQKPKS